MQKSGASFLVSAAAFGFVWLPLQGPLMACVWRDTWWLCLSCASTAHGRSVTSLPWPDPSDHLVTAPSMHFRPCTHSRIPTPFYTDLPVLASLFRELFPSSGQLMTSSGPENFSAIVGCNHTFFNEVWLPAMERGLLLRFSFLGASLSVLGYPLEFSLYFQLFSFHTLIIPCIKLLLNYYVIFVSWRDPVWSTRSNQTHSSLQI